jgi:hypothetical protein
MFLRNVGELISDYVALQPRIQYASSFLKLACVSHWSSEKRTETSQSQDLLSHPGCNGHAHVVRGCSICPFVWSAS